jgi:hypothetical protein
MDVTERDDSHHGLGARDVGTQYQREPGREYLESEARA